MSGSWPNIERRESLQGETCICKDCEYEGTRHCGSTGKCLVYLSQRCGQEGEVERSLGKLKCLWTLLSGWAFCCKHARLLGKGQTHRSVLGRSFQCSAPRSVAVDQQQWPLLGTWWNCKFSAPIPDFRIRNSGHGAWESVLYQGAQLIPMHT